MSFSIQFFLRLVVSLSWITLAGCSSFTHKDKSLTFHAPTQSEEFVPHKDWVGLQLPYPEFEKLRKSLELDLGAELKNRGEAHITVITPPEFYKWKASSKSLEMKDLEKEVKAELQAAKWKAVCVGSGQKDQMKTYFVVIDSPELFGLRQKLAKLGALDADHFYPHVTLGFTERDLHEQDGVIKNEKACAYSLHE